MGGVVKKAVKAVTSIPKKVVKEGNRALKRTRDETMRGVRQVTSALMPTPDINIPGPDPSQIAAANLQNNLSQDLGLENVANVEVGGQDISESASKRRRQGQGGVSSSLGIV